MSGKIDSFERVTCKGVRRVFGRTRALSRVDIELFSSKITALIGNNGAGKTTLLSILSTLLSPTSGEILYGSTPYPQSTASLRRAIGFLSHTTLLYPELSAIENLEFTCRLYGLRAAGELATKALEEIGLDPDVWNRQVGTYSRGMLQRLSLARATIHNPHLLLLDEPFSGLDFGAADNLMKVLDRKRKEGSIVLLVTHNLKIASKLADSVAIMHRGKIVCEIEGRIEESALNTLYLEQTGMTSTDTPVTVR